MFFKVLSDISHHSLAKSPFLFNGLVFVGNEGVSLREIQFDFHGLEWVGGGNVGNEVLSG